MPHPDIDTRSPDEQRPNAKRSARFPVATDDAPSCVASGAYRIEPGVKRNLTLQPQVAGARLGRGLSPTLPMEADESTTSYVSRLAHLHGKVSRRLCADLGLGYQAVVDGGTAALERLALISGAPLALVRHNAVFRTGRREHRLRGQAIGSENLSRYTLRVCPLCIQDDLRSEIATQGPGPYGRVLWLLSQIRTCPTHRVALVPLPSSWETVHDFAATLRPELTRFRAGEVPAEARVPSAFEGYLIDRLEGQPRPDAGWLDALGFSAVVETCEVIGAVAAFGRSVNLRALGTREWHVAGDFGFAIMISGPAGIREALAAWDAGMADDRRPGAPWTMTYGPFHSFLDRDHAYRPDLEPIRSVVVDHLMWTTPVGPGDVVIGRRIGERYVHSVRTAADAYGLDTRLVRKLLRQAGALGPDSNAHTNRTALFDARANEDLLEVAKRLVRYDAVRFHINASKVQTRAILRSGLIPTFMPGNGPFSDWAHMYEPSDLDGFLDQLAGRAEEVSSGARGTVGIIRAASMVGCNPVTIVRLILDQRLPWVGQLAGKSGHDAMQVYPGDVADQLRAGAAAP